MTRSNDRRQLLRRFLTGGALALGLYLLGAWFVYGLDFFGSGWTAYPPFEVWRLLFVPYPWKTAGSLLCIALFGGEIACATLPFAEDGKRLLLRSALHFLAMCATVFVWGWLNLAGGVWEYLALVLALALTYCVVWLGRWVGWYAELARMREKLGLAPGPSPLKWRETLPYLAFAAAAFALLPALAWKLCEAMLGSLLNYLLLSVGGACSGFSLGKRQGFCPLYPPFCGLILYPVVQGIYNIAPSVCWVPFGFALMGMAAGAVVRSVKTRRNQHA